MTTYNMLKTPNQKFSTDVNGHQFEFQFRTFRKMIYCSVIVDGVLLQAGARALPNTSIFSETINKLAGGRFIFRCITNDYPDFSDYDGNTVVLAYEEE